VWIRLNIVYLISCVAVFSLLNAMPKINAEAEGIVWIVASLSYPLSLALTERETRFWRGLLYLLLILTIAQSCGFCSYLISYGVQKYPAFGSGREFVALMESNARESFQWFVALSLIPSLITLAICYPLASLMCWWFARFRKRLSH
jgi:hypothetical protein